MADLDKQPGESSLKTDPATPSADNTAEQARLAHSNRKRRTFVIWLRVIALLFAGLFFLSQCGMSKPKAKAAIVESCIKNVPFHPKWQADLKQRNLQDANGKLVSNYCVCMWDEPLQKLSAKQIQSFAKLTPQQQLDLLGGEQAFTARDTQCLNRLKQP